MSTDGNLEKYQSEAVVAYYRGLTGLQPAEEYLFLNWLEEGSDILDLGVGGGRTTPVLSTLARRYVGADYSTAMVAACRQHWPGLDFVHCDATTMSCFEDRTFDAVVFPFNGIDVIRSDEGRAKCLAEIARVLKSEGLFIFSSHNARVLGQWPQLKDARGFRIPWRILRAVAKSASLAVRMLSSRAFWRHEGYIHDPVHGGMNHYVSTPRTIKKQVEAAGFSIVEVVNGHFPVVRSPSLAPWFYYACKRST
jgi:SAM-dependent methyltransferase